VDGADTDRTLALKTYRAAATNLRAAIRRADIAFWAAFADAAEANPPPRSVGYQTNASDNRVLAALLYARTSVVYLAEAEQEERAESAERYAWDAYAALTTLEDRKPRFHRPGKTLAANPRVFAVIKLDSFSHEEQHLVAAVRSHQQLESRRRRREARSRSRFDGFKARLEF
jgi:hypothetical protein